MLGLYRVHTASGGTVMKLLARIRAEDEGNNVVA